ncbi:Hypothetical predicted protein [Pelobates cultripes]|uniref:Uncharacterized protein n=1 Tax=Pelobates cultripes TaxID=61616 RepID=A0AAD1RR89_PELCU|nr:Hypothetical predicted protein [Pelobates cultripes]
MAPASSCSGGEPITLADIGAELRHMTALMFTKEDLHRVSDTLHAALKTEEAGLKDGIALHNTRIAAMEQRKETTEKKLKATDTAIQRQGDLLLVMRRQLEDLDNRGRHNNIRVRGVPEADSTGGNVAETLAQHFRIILREEAPDHFRFDRAHSDHRQPTEHPRYNVLYSLLPTQGPDYAEGPHPLDRGAESRRHPHLPAKARTTQHYSPKLNTTPPGAQATTTETTTPPRQRNVGTRLEARPGPT